jgi:4-amino-4-deoxy-L-arabinose transferase-like glycosyltransferase
MTSGRTVLVVALLLGLLAGGLRFFRLGAYPFAGDETATIEEAQSLLAAPTGLVSEQTDRLPRLIPLSHLIHALDYGLFGCDEFGSRALMALEGTLAVVLVFVGLSRPLGSSAALATALLVTVWPDHLFHSQQNRFYITAALFVSLCLVLGAQAVQRRSAWWTVGACLAALAAMLAHTIQVVLLPGLFVAILAATWAERKPVPWRMLLVVVLSGLAAVAIYLFYLRQIGGGWNAAEIWGYGPGRSLLASAMQPGWPVALLALLGAILFVRQRSAQGWYWLTWLGVWAAASAALPFAVVYHPNYVFPLAVAVLVLAGWAVAQVAERLRPAGAVVVVAWVSVALALQLPSVVSHYLDGSRPDYRTAARYVAEHWRSGDRLASISPGLVQHYAPLDGEFINLPRWNALPALRQAAAGPGRLWVVLASGRSGKEEAIGAWLGTHCTQQLQVRKRRFDYYEFTVEVFLYSPAPESVVEDRSEGTVAPAERTDRR